MAHKTLIGGTAYEISGGKTLVGGTAYSIAGGKTLVGGTAYDISFWSADPVLGNNDPATIRKVAKAGQAPNYWAVGDKIGIYLSGTVGNLSLSGTYYAFIIGFNHNSGIEGNNTIHFQFGKTADGTDIAFVDSNNGDYVSSGFCMNTSNTSSGGWASSYMRSTICPAFKSAMPTAWQNVIAPCTKYTDNTGGGSNTSSYVTTTSDYIFCLAEFEVHGDQKQGNTSEQNFQKQYDYYKSGNSAIKCKHNATTTKCVWWSRSPASKTAFCRTNTSTSFGLSLLSSANASYSYGFAPGFMVA